MPDDPILRALANCDPNEPLEPSDPRFVDFDEIRGFTLRKRLSRLLDAAAQPPHVQYVQVAVAGHRGAGKSTELNRVQADLVESGYCTMRAAVDDILDRENISFSDVIRLLLLLLEDFFGNEVATDEHVRDAFQNVNDWFREVTKSREQVVADATEFALSASLGGSVNAEASVGVIKLKTDLGKFLGALNAVSKSETKARTEIREAVERYPDQLVSNLNLLLRALRMRFPGRVGKGLVFILDNVDKYQNAMVNQAFLRYSSLFHQIEAHIVFTIQAALLHNPPEGSVSDGFNSLELPMLPVFADRSRTPRPDVVERIRQAVYLRVPRELFGEGDAGVDKFVIQSGGCWRDLLRLIQAALLGAPAEILTRQDRERAQHEVAQIFHRLIQKPEQLKILARTHQSFNVLSDEDTRYLLYHRCLLNYNHVGWYGVHPLMESYPPFRTELAALAPHVAS